jgi:hypothetical protein
VALHEPLGRGSARTGGKATTMGVDEFARRVAEREGVDIEQARTTRVRSSGRCARLSGASSST